MGSGIISTVLDKIILEEKMKENIEYLSKVNPLYIEYSNYLERSKLNIKKKHFELLKNGKNPDKTPIK
jgi:hypothetical protein